MDHKLSDDDIEFEWDSHKTYVRDLNKPFSINEVHDDNLPTPELMKAKINEKTVYAVNQSMNVIHTDIEGNVLYGNQNIFDLTLYNPEELLGKHTRIFNAGYHSKEFFKNMWDTILAGKIWRGDVKNKRKDGKIIWVRLIITPLLDKSGKPYEFIALKEDITEKKEIEFRLAQKDKQLSALTNNSYDIIGIMDRLGKIIYLNAAFERVLGFNSSEAIGCNIEDYMDEDDAPFKNCMLKRIIENPESPLRHQAKFKHKDGTIRWCDTVFSNYLKDPYIQGIVFNIRDYTKQKEATDIINHFANHDYLTGLPNRRNFENQLENALEEAKANNQPLAILSLDLDGFKQINDTYGHETGDNLLKMVGHRISCGFMQKAFVGRIGGDEFSIFIPEIHNENYLCHLADSLLQSFEPPFIVDGYNINISASIGISIYPLAGSDIKTLLRHADIAMYQAKKEGKNLYRIYTAEIDLDK